MVRLSFYFLMLSALGCSRSPVETKSAPKSADCDCCEVDRSQLVALLADAKPASGDSPMFGGTPQRNMANLTDKNVLTDWSVEEGKEKNVKWTAALGSKAYGGPVIAGGKIFVGTNNANPRDPNIKGSKAVIMAFNEADGKFLWQIAHDYPASDIFKEAIGVGMVSTPVVESNRLYYVTPGCEVVCAGTDGKVQWRYDMMKELKVIPFHCAACSPLIAGNLVIVITGNGIGEEGKVAAPEAPSFAAFDKTSGKLVWKSSLPGANIIEGQFSNPALAKVKGRDQVIFPGGDSYLYGLDAASGKLIWKFNCQPQLTPANPDPPDLCYMVSTPVVHKNKVYVGLGVAPDTARNPPYGYLLCVDITKSGDVSPKSLDSKDPKNQGSALVWSYGGKINPVPKKGRRVVFGRTISTCAIHDGLVYISEETGYLHCLDLNTGQKQWDHDFKAGIWGSPYYVDGKVYIGTDEGDVYIFAHGKNEKILGKVEMGEGIQTTPVVARGTLYVMTKSKLFALAEKK